MKFAGFTPKQKYSAAEGGDLRWFGSFC